MKKYIVFVLLLALAVIFIPWLHPARATDQSRVNVYEDQKKVKSVVFAIGMDEYFVNGQTPGVKMDAVTFIENDRTYVPVRYLAYALGLTQSDVAWDNDKQKATLKKGNIVLEMTIGKKEIVTNGQTKTIDVVPLLKSEPAWRTYLPARFVAEGLGYQVDWDEATRTVICYPKGDPKPDVSGVQKYVGESAGKPGEVKELESLLGVVTSPDGYPVGSEWRFAPPWEKWTWDDSIRKLANENNDRSYLVLHYYEDGTIGVDIRWVRNLSDIRYVELDLSPVEKVLNWKFPDQPGQVHEIMAYAQQVAEKTRATGGFERLPIKDYSVDGHKVSIGAVGGNFAGMILTKK